MLIAIPSKGRPDKIKSHKLLPGAVVYVPENEVVHYVACGVENVQAVPNGVLGITKTRNWILDNAGDGWVVFVDDDVKRAGYLEVGLTRMFYRPIEDWVAEFVRLFDVTEAMGYRIWGVATMSAPRAWYPYKPFFWKSYVTASCMGVLASSGIRFDENFPVKEDYEICLRCIKEDGGVVAARYIFWENAHWADAGGCADYRTQGMETEAINRLMSMYPGLIRKVTRGGSDYSIHLEF